MTDHLDDVHVVIIGAGLSGLRCAQLVQERGVPCIVLEARGRVGGRLLSHRGPSEEAFDLGAAWVWPETQPRVVRLATRLGLELFPQHVEGFFQVERQRGEAPRRFELEQSGPVSMRIEGGTALLAERVARSLAPGTVRLGCAVERLELGPKGVTLEWRHDDRIERAHARRVVIALPPRVASRGITFHPTLDDGVRHALLDAPTWMAAHAKALALYAEPFWRRKGLSGAAASALGPLGEIHDASAPAGAAALFGFFLLPASARTAAGATTLREACVAQLVRLFGADAKEPLQLVVQDWTSESYTSGPGDEVPPPGHPAYAVIRPTWNDRLHFAGTETAQASGGYLEGALEAAERAAAAVLA